MAKVIFKCSNWLTDKLNRFMSFLRVYRRNRLSHIGHISRHEILNRHQPKLRIKAFSKFHIFINFLSYCSWYIKVRKQCIEAECDIREILSTNECPNIIVSTKLHEWISEYIHTNLFDTNECPNQYSYWKLHEYSNIFEYSSRFYTLTHSPTNVRIYSYKQIWHERMSDYIRNRKIDTNECPKIYLWPIYSNILIFEYIRHTPNQNGQNHVNVWCGQCPMQHCSPGSVCSEVWPMVSPLFSDCAPSSS